MYVKCVYIYTHMYHDILYIDFTSVCLLQATMGIEPAKFRDQAANMCFEEKKRRSIQFFSG